MPSALCPDGEMDDHASLLTRSFGFESWSGHWIIRAVSSAGQSASMTRWSDPRGVPPEVRPLHRPLKLRIRKGHPTGDGTRLESGATTSGGARALRVRLPPLPLRREPVDSTTLSMVSVV